MNLFTHLGFEETPQKTAKEQKSSSLDQMFHRSDKYHNSQNYIDSLKFIIKTKNLAPFNAWIIKEQNPDVDYVATADEWLTRFNREIKHHARAYVILKPFSPVEFVYDMNDTTGDDLPLDLQANFRAEGVIKDDYVKRILACCDKKGIKVNFNSTLMNRQAGWASHNILNKSKTIVINKSHKKELQFSTLCHELAHLILGHLRIFTHCECKDRSHLSTHAMEVEAESVSWLVCDRLGIKTDAERYLSYHFKSSQDVLNQISIDNILTTAGKIENIILSNSSNACKREKTKK